MQQITNDNINKAQLVIALHDHMLTWYIKYCFDNPIASLAKTKENLNDFIKAKYDS